MSGIPAFVARLTDELEADGLARPVALGGAVSALRECATGRTGAGYRTRDEARRVIEEFTSAKVGMEKELREGVDLAERGFKWDPAAHARVLARLSHRLTVVEGFGLTLRHGRTQLLVEAARRMFGEVSDLRAAVDDEVRSVRFLVEALKKKPVVVQEASYSNGAARSYGGAVPPLLAAGVISGSGGGPYVGGENSDPPSVPPGLREAAAGVFQRCLSCVHFDSKGACLLYKWRVDGNMVSDSYLTLTPIQQQRFAADLEDMMDGLTEAVSERVAAQAAGDADRFTEAFARERMIRESRERLLEAADSLAKASSHEKVGHTGQGLWHHKGLQLPAYIQHIANDLREKRGMDESRAIATAIAAVKRWARGGGKVDATTRAAAAKAVAEWEKLKASHGGGLKESAIPFAQMGARRAFDAAKHPRNRQGEWTDVLGKLAAPKGRGRGASHFPGVTKAGKPVGRAGMSSGTKGPHYSYAPEVIADSSGKWAGNSLRYRTEGEAKASAEALGRRWTLVRDTRAVPSTDRPSYEHVPGQRHDRALTAAEVESHVKSVDARSRKGSARPAVTGEMKPRSSPMEGPFRYRSGWEGMYDPKEGRYYDHKSDVYMPRDFDPETGLGANGRRSPVGSDVKVPPPSAFPGMNDMNDSKNYPDGMSSGRREVVPAGVAAQLVAKGWTRGEYKGKGAYEMIAPDAAARSGMFTPAEAAKALAALKRQQAAEIASHASGMSSGVNISDPALMSARGKYRAEYEAARRQADRAQNDGAYKRALDRLARANEAYERAVRDVHAHAMASQRADAGMSSGSKLPGADEVMTHPDGRTAHLFSRGSTEDAKVVVVHPDGERTTHNFRPAGISKAAEEALHALSMSGFSSGALTHAPAGNLTGLPLHEIAAMIRKDWSQQGKGVNFAARPYLDAMMSMASHRDNYGADTGRTVLAYFLSNAASYKGEQAKAIKAELKRRLRESPDPGGFGALVVAKIDKLEEAAAEREAAQSYGDSVAFSVALAREQSLREAVLTAAARKKIPKGEFAVPETRSYPIHDLAHARNALARSSGKPEEGRVRAAVYRKYPALKQAA